jgi:plastocyanin
VNKPTKIILWVIVALLSVCGIYYFGYMKPPSVFVQRAPSVTPLPGSSSFPTSVASASSSVPSIKKTVAVAYTDVGFSPASVSINKGDTVRFVNQSSEKLWVGSNPHPVHNGYPTTGGCRSSTFDSCKEIAAGDAWEFTFDIAGTWGYHNHLNPGKGGTVVVQ